MSESATQELGWPRALTSSWRAAMVPLVIVFVVIARQFIRGATEGALCG